MLTNTSLKYGGAMRDRTADLFAASEALSQLSYSPACLKYRWPSIYISEFEKCIATHRKRGAF